MLTGDSLDLNIILMFLDSHNIPFLVSRIIAEGVPESQTRAFNRAAQKKGVGIIGPATVGGIKVGLSSLA